MKERLLGFIQALRAAGVPATPGETLDAMAAVGRVGVERERLREALAATLVKDQADRPTFDDLFDRYFSAPGRRRGKGAPAAIAAGEGGRGRGDGARGRRGEQGHGQERRERRDARQSRVGEQSRRDESKAAEKLARRRALRVMPFREMGPREVEEAREFLEQLAERFRSRWSRRTARARRGRLDMRRTVRRALSRGGVPIELLFRAARPGKCDLVALVDLSHSTATAAHFLLSLLAPAEKFFRRVRWFAFVDRLAEIAFENGQVIPLERLDLAARSDFGRVLADVEARCEPWLDRNTVLLVLGDARNNWRPPRVDLLRRLREQVRAVVWLNPDPVDRWNTGDSAIAAYGREIDLLLPAADLRSLLAALDRLLRLAL